MILTEVSLKNFRVYSGEHTLKLNPPQGGRSVYLIGGLNGAGKTSLLHAVALGLFGVDAVGIAFQRSGLDIGRAYRQYLEEALSWSACELGGQMSVGISFTEGGSPVRVRRDWWFERGGKLDDESLYIYEGSAPVRVEARTEAERLRILQEYVEGVAPARVGKFFFFDGEEIRSIASRNPDLSVLEGLNQLLGFEALQRLVDDLQTVRASLRRELPGASESGLSAAVADAEDVRTRLATGGEELGEAVKGREATARQLEEVESELATMFDGRAIQTRSEALDGLAKLERELAAVSGEIQLFVAEVLCLTLPGEVAQRTAKRAVREARARRVREARTRIRPLRDALADYVVTGTELSAKQAEVVRSRIAQAWAELVEASDSELAILAVFSTEELEAIPAAIGQAQATARRELGARLARRAHIQSEIQRLRRIQGMFETGHRAQELLGRKGALVRLLIEQEAAVERRDADLAGLAREHATKSGLVTRLERELATDDEIRAELDAVDRMQAATEALMAELREERTSGLAAKTTVMMSLLAHKEDLVTAVTIDPSDFRIKLDGHDGQELVNPSAGEREVFALSLVWALAQTSGRSLPMIIDTPLGRLDQAHRSNIVTRFLPVAAEQVIVLVTDSEIDATWHAALQPHLAQEVLIEFSSEGQSSAFAEGRYFELPARAAI
jgi:DNA sulfur modification protein DndD